MTCTVIASAQSMQSEYYVIKITQRLKDTLSLTREQVSDIYQLNQKLQYAKDSVWKYFTDEMLIRNGLQAVENKRDSLYGTIFTTEQLILYKEKKIQLISNK